MQALTSQQLLLREQADLTEASLRRALEELGKTERRRTAEEARIRALQAESDQAAARFKTAKSECSALLEAMAEVQAKKAAMSEEVGRRGKADLRKLAGLEFLMCMM